MCRTCDRVFRNGLAWAEETTDKIVFPIAWRRNADHFSQRKHGVNIRAYCCNLLLILHNDHVITCHADFFVFRDTQRFQ
ncbi:hypothetical protein D3C81_1432420 [compost metagenome]